MYVCRYVCVYVYILVVVVAVVVVVVVVVVVGGGRRLQRHSRRRTHDPWRTPVAARFANNRTAAAVRCAAADAGCSTMRSVGYS